MLHFMYSCDNLVALVNPTSYSAILLQIFVDLDFFFYIFLGSCSLAGVYQWAKGVADFQKGGWKITTVCYESWKLIIQFNFTFF